MKRARWLAIRNTPRDLWKRLGHYVFSGGTAVRRRDESTEAGRLENERLRRFQATCNGNWQERQKKLRAKKEAQ